MTTTEHPALARFLEARSDRSGRASARAGIEACRALSDRLDEALRELAGAAVPFAVANPSITLSPLPVPVEQHDEPDQHHGHGPHRRRDRPVSG